MCALSSWKTKQKIESDNATQKQKYKYDDDDIPTKRKAWCHKAKEKISTNYKYNKKPD